MIRELLLAGFLLSCSDTCPTTIDAACNNAKSGDTCPMTIDAACNNAKPACIRTWDDAQKPTSYCGLVGVRIWVSTCPNTRFVNLTQTDTSTSFFYDANGALYRIEGFSAGSEKCGAGGGALQTCTAMKEIGCP